jgi:colicin import membrane protein
LSIDADRLVVDPVTHMAQSRPLFAALLMASVALHVLALFILNLMERAPPIQPNMSIEIPVELVSDPAASAKKGSRSEAKDGTTAAGSSGQPGSEAKSSAKPATEQAAKSQASATPPKPPAAAGKQAEAKPPSDVKPPELPKPEAPKPAATPPELPKPAAQAEPPKPPPAPTEPPKPPAPAVSTEAPKPPPQPAPTTPAQAATAQPPPAAAMPPMEKLQLPHPSAAASPEAMMDDDPLLAVAVPKAGDEGDEEISYKTLVFSMLELAKQYPADARARGAAGAARIYFEIDDTGAVKTVKLRESSGDTELDVESLALVERAAPFPKPPRGAQKSFNAVIEYGSNEH